MSKTSNLKKITYTSLIIAIALVLRNFSYMISFGGGAGLRISAAGFFTAIPAILFGPFYGGVTYGIIDVLGYLIKPEGAYILPLTLTEMLKGVMIGFLFKFIRNVNSYKMRNCFLVSGLVLGMVGAFNHIMINLYPTLPVAEFLSGLGKRTAFFTIGLEGIAVILIVLFSIDYFSKKLFGSKHTNDFIKILTVLFISNLIITTANTFLLRIFMPGISKIAFFVFYIPRLVEEIIVTVLQSFVTAYLIKVFKKINN